jgi:hypothetical protein
MNIKELEALVIAQDHALKALTEGHRQQLEAHMHLVQRADNIVEGFKQELAGRDERIQELSAVVNEQAQVIVQAVNFFESWPTVQSAIEGTGEAQGLHEVRIETLEKLVMARNASAPTKRNMTDEDALKVLTGDLKDLSHKEAAEKAGLTYAQVYSCRLEFTFKHVHKTLRDGATPDAPWVNAWAK